MIQFVFVNEKIEIDATEYLYESNDLISSAMQLEYETSIDEESNVAINRLEDVDGSTCDLIMQIAKYNGTRQLLVQINILDPENFNELAYRLKAVVKETLIKDWKQCVWLEDSQSALYAQQLYSRVYKIENMLRKFINIVMVNQLGISWWENHVSDKISKTHNERHFHQRRTAPLYQNVDTKLVSIDTGQLTAIMEYKQKAWVPEFDETIEKLIVSTAESNVASLKAKLQRQLKVENDSWEIIFSRYFEKEFIEDWKEFCNYRNHIAHNKLIDKQANSMIRSNFGKVEDQINKAFEIYSSTTLSDEDKEKIATLGFKAEMEFMESEAGVEINDSDVIQEILGNYLEGLAIEVEEEFHFRNDLEISHSVIPKNLEGEILNISSKIEDGNSINLRISAWLDGDAGGRSTVRVALIVSDEVVNSFEVIYMNGDSYFNEEQGNYMPVQENELIPLDNEKLIEEVHELVDNHFPNKVDQISVLNYSRIKNGGPSVAGEFPCEECGEETVSIYDDFHEFGVCVSCGHNQSSAIENCLRCETYYNSNIGGSGGFCEGCESFINSQ